MVLEKLAVAEMTFQGHSRSPKTTWFHRPHTIS